MLFGGDGGAAAADALCVPVPEKRLELIHLLLTVVQKPSEEDRAAIVSVCLPSCVCVLFFSLLTSGLQLHVL
jgi:hypothetical protein